MFIVRKSEEITIEWPVVVEMPVAGGGIRKFEFTGIFARLPETELQDLHDLAKTTADEERLNDKRRPHVDAVVFFSRVMKGWKSVQDEAGQPIEFSPEALESILGGSDGTVFSIALWSAYSKLRAGAKAKN